MAMANETSTAREMARVMAKARARAMTFRQQQQTSTAAAAAAILRTSINQVEQLLRDVEKITTNSDSEKGLSLKKSMYYYSLF
jgi:hypothetical protein